MRNELDLNKISWNSKEDTIIPTLKQIHKCSWAMSRIRRTSCYMTHGNSWIYQLNISSRDPYQHLQTQTEIDWIERRWENYNIHYALFWFDACDKVKFWEDKHGRSVKCILIPVRMQSEVISDNPQMSQMWDGFNWKMPLKKEEGLNSTICWNQPMNLWMSEQPVKIKRKYPTTVDALGTR